MKQKIIAIMVFAGIGLVAHAQLNNPIYHSKLTFGNWKCNIRFDSLKVGDTLILTNDNQARRYDMNFTDSGKVTWYDERVDPSSTSLEIFDEWQQIGTWKKNESGNIEVQTALPEPAYPNKKNKNIAFAVVSESYTLVKMRVIVLTAK